MMRVCKPELIWDAQIKKMMQVMLKIDILAW
jgi:hypothetical protein